MSRYRRASDVAARVAVLNESRVPQAQRAPAARLGARPVARALRSWMHRRQATVLLCLVWADAWLYWRVPEARKAYRRVVPWCRLLPVAVACLAILPIERLALPRALAHLECLAWFGACQWSEMRSS